MPSARAQRQVRTSLWSLLWLVLVSPSLFAQAPPSADTFASSAFSKTNFGAVGTMNVGPGSTSYVQFNLSGIPTGATVTKATLRLYVDLVISNGTFDVYQVNKSWSESALTYNNQPLPLGTSATGGHPVSITSSSFSQFVLIDVTSLVQGWLGGTIPNYGVALALPSGSGANFYLDSKESLLTANGPQLIIALSGAAGPQGPQGPQGLTGLTGATGPTGATGATGPAGPTGAQGTPGAQGPQGLIGPMGLTGAQGPQGNPGTAGTPGAPGQGFNFRGAFDGSASYAAYDVVSYSGSSYNAKAATNPGDPTPDVNPNWGLMAQQGAAGPAGAAGTQGAQGSAGPQGSPGPQGLPGAAGPKGDTGSIGPIGITGAQGPPGPGNSVSLVFIDDTTGCIPEVGSPCSDTTSVGCPAGTAIVGCVASPDQFCIDGSNAVIAVKFSGNTCVASSYSRVGECGAFRAGLTVQATCLNVP